jgi:pimeloyl-ACP methyl ester carboxylesterase
MTATERPALPPDPVDPELASRSAADREAQSAEAPHAAAWTEVDDAEDDDAEDDDAEDDYAEDEEAHSVLLIHGQPGSSLIWTRVRPKLCARGLHVLSIDRPGYGHTTGEALNQFDNAAAIAAVLDSQHTNPTIVVGHSLGAGIALALAATAPHHVRALVLIAPAAGPSAITATDRALAAPILGPTLSWLGFRTAGLALHIPVLRRRILTDRIGLSATDADEVVRRITRREVWRSLTVEQRHLVTDAHLIEESLAGITCPIVIVAGTRDRIVRPRIVAALARQLPESNLITTDTGHLIPIDNPDAVVNAVLRALRWQYRNSLSGSAGR